MPVRKNRRELYASASLCILFSVSAFGLIREYTSILDIYARHAVYASSSPQNILGAQTAAHTPTQTPAPTAIPTKPLETPTQKKTTDQEKISTTSLQTLPDDFKTTKSDSPSTTETQNAPSVSSSTQDMLNALNTYRQKKGIAPLALDSTLQSFAQSRADYFAGKGSMDNHAGFQEMLAADGFAKMGFNALGENSSYGAFGSSQNLIENIYGTHPPHDENQLKGEWTHVGIGISGDATDFVFGGRKR